MALLTCCSPLTRSCSLIWGSRLTPYSPIISRCFGLTVRPCTDTQSVSPPDFRHMDCDAIAAHLDCVDWKTMFSSCSSVNDMYSEFVACCRFLIDHFTPHRSTSRSSSAVGKCFANLRDRLERDESQSRSLSNRLKRTALRQRTLEELKLDFGDARAFFRYSNSRLRGRDPLPAMSYGDTTVYTSPEKADLLADHFASVYDSHYAGSPPPCLTDDASRSPVSGGYFSGGTIPISGVLAFQMLKHS